MVYTIVVSVMEQKMTSDEVKKIFNLKVEMLLRNGWTPAGEVLYYPNAITIAMQKGEVAMEEIVRSERYGSRTPRELTYRLGGRGHMGEKHWM